MNNSFLNQFAPNIKFSYFCFDRVIIRGYIRHLFLAGGVAILLKVLGFRQTTSGVMRILTDQLNTHIEKVARQRDIPIHWWPSQGGGTDGAKLAFVKKKYANAYTGKGDHVYCIIADKEPSQTFASREFTTKKGKPFHKLYKCRKPVKHFYIYFHDGLLGGPCYLKICSYLPFQCEFYFNGHNAAKLKMDKEGIGYAMKDNAFIKIENPERFKEIVKELDGRAVQQRVEHWKNVFFKFDKGSYSTRTKHLEHEWYKSQNS